ncbi:hypothetical protein BBJ28_00010187 [Nothophytophthora sp. Chile5]|nr:hypothetical protein BBJ28_00010187 [Nothophytophthora sp. Chile5]
MASRSSGKTRRHLFSFLDKVLTLFYCVVCLARFHLLQPKAEDSASMYAVQTTSRSLPNQALLRKEVEALCSRIFSSTAHARVLRAVGDSMRGTHLIFIDGAETLLTHLCQQLNIDYTSGLALTFAPLLIASGSEPLSPELVETLAATCRRFLPHIGQQLPVRSAATARRLLLKRLLLYHAPRLSFHLDQNFPTWNNAPPEEYDASAGGEGSGAIPDSWLASFFEADSIMGDATGFDFSLKVWDSSLLLEAFTSSEVGPLTTCCFITIYAIVRTEKQLLRMEGEQLRHCMASTLVETLLHGDSEDAGNEQRFVQSVQQLMNVTPPSFCAKLRRAGLIPTTPAVDTVASSEAKASDALSATATSGGFGMNSLLSASTQGVKDFSNLMIDMPVKLMIDMPVKLFTMVPLNPMTAFSPSAPTPSITDSPETQQLFHLHVQAMAVAAMSMMLAADEVVPSVFGGFQGAETATAAIRYFIVDCRSLEETCGGQVPTAFHFDPDAVTDPSVLDQVLATLGPMKSAGVHICVMGHGYAYVAEELRQFQEQQDSAATAMASPFSMSEGFLERYASDQTRVNAAVLFLVKQGFPHVSVLDGGYAAAHGHLFRSLDLTVDDLVDHDAPHCSLCQHDRSMQTLHAEVSGGINEPTRVEDKLELVLEESTASTAVAPANTVEAACEASAGRASAAEHPAKLAVDSFSTFSDVQLSPANAGAAKPASASSYYSSFTGALKTSGKTILSPTMDGTMWLLKKSAATTADFANAAANMGTKARTGSISGASGAAASAGEAKSSSRTDSSTRQMMPGTNALPNLNKLRNSLAFIGSESLDMLKKVEHAVEHAAVASTSTAKSRLAFPSSLSPAPKDSSAVAAAVAPATNTGTPRPDAPRATLSSDPAHSGFFHQSTDEMFTIDDDDDEEDHFANSSVPSRVEGNGSRSSSSSSLKESPSGYADLSAVLHDVVIGRVHELKKGMWVSRAQMLPCASSPFFSCYKKKAPTEASSSITRSSMQPRRLVVVENHIMALRAATRNEDDVYVVKSCHPLAHVARMTCLKKNALMVSIYYKWKAANGQIVERRNSYEVQQRDGFIKAVKTAMDKM